MMKVCNLHANIGFLLLAPRFSQSHVMIGLVVEDGECPVELLGKDHTHHLVRERHLAQRQLVIGSAVHIGREAIRPTDDKHHAAHTGRHAFLHIGTKLHRRHFLPMLVEQHNIVGLVDAGQNSAPLGQLLLSLAQVAGVLDILQILDIERHIVAKPGDVVIETRLEVASCGLSDHQKRNFHPFQQFRVQI